MTMTRSECVLFVCNVIAAADVLTKFYKGLDNEQYRRLLELRDRLLKMLERGD